MNALTMASCASTSPSRVLERLRTGDEAAVDEGTRGTADAEALALGHVVSNRLGALGSSRSRST